MRHLVKAVALALLVLSAPSVVFADYVTDAAQALQNASVYVAPNTEGTNNDTAGRLQDRLDKDDNIVLVMLPATAEAELGADISAIAAALSEELGNQRIIGLAVGNNVVGYAAALPAGVATDQMRRARSVSNDPVTALGTFAQNMHTWQDEHPQENPPPVDLNQEGGLSWLVWLAIAGAAALVAGIAFIALLGMTTSSANKERTRFKAPDQVKDLLAKIARQRERVHDIELKGVLYQMCLDIERYFLSSSKNKKKDSLFFKDRLTEVTEVLTKYIDVQENLRYYDKPRTELSRGKSSIEDFSQYVLKSIRRGNAADLVDYTVNTQILQAQRYR